MTLLGGGALGVWHSVVAVHVDEVEHWYNHEHHAERIAVPGFLRARRYVNLGDGPRYFSRYDVRQTEVLASAPYIAALNNPSPWSQRIFPHYRDTVRGVFRVTSRVGVADGGVIASLRWTGLVPVDRSRLERELTEAAERLADAFGVLRIEIWRADESITTTPTREKELRAKSEDFPSHAMVVDACAAESARAAIESHLAPVLRRAAIVDMMQLAFHSAAASNASTAGSGMPGEH